MKRVAMCVFGIVLLSGCATKQYPQVPAVTGEESVNFDCQAIKQDIAKTHSIQQEIESTGDFDGKTVLGVLGDFGIGNGIAKEDARTKAEARLEQLESLKLKRCQ
ncbi:MULTISPECIES: hypothetical protein [Enterobacterales]|uniref:hypothetical protein n=1 Tax=Enterobacterales TaxID=91347 RepID=UPI002ED95FF8